jgi:hypothetical protein
MAEEFQICNTFQDIRDLTVYGGGTLLVPQPTGTSEPVKTCNLIDLPFTGYGGFGIGGFKGPYNLPWGRYSSVDIATGWTVRGSNPGGGEIIRTRPE